MRRGPLHTRRQVVVFLVCVSIFALGQFHRASGGVFTPILMDRYALSAATVGALVSAMFLATLVAQLPFGMILDRRGPRSVLTFCILLVAIGTGIFAVRASFEVSVMSRVLIGVGLASMGAASHVIIARNFERRDFGYVSGLVVTMGGIGGLAGTYPLAVALEHLPWALVFGGVALLTLMLSGAIFAAIRPDPGADSGVATGLPTDGFATLLRDAEFRKILALGVVTFAPITTISGLWGGPFLQDVVGLRAEAAGAVLMIFFVMTISAGSAFGALDRYAKSRKRVVLVAVSISCAALTTLALLDQPPAALAIALLLIMVFFQQFYIPLGAHMRKQVPDHLIARGSTLLALFSVAAIPLMQVGFGTVLDAAAARGFAPADQYRFAFGAMALTIAVCGLIYATSRHADEPRQTG